MRMPAGIHQATIHKFLRSAKGAARATKEAGNSFAPRSVLRELLRSAKGAARTTKEAGNSFAPRSVLRELLRSAKGAARATKEARNCFAPRSVLRELLRSAKGAARTTKEARNCFAPRSVLRELLRSTVAMAGGLALAVASLTLVAWGQEPPPPPSYPPQELDRLVSRVALYPDPLLSQIFAAATFPDQIPPAAQWSDQHHYLTGDALAGAISADRLPWDPSVQALLPFPSVLATMASDMAWTSELGNAFLAQQPDLMDAVQRERHRAYEYGYLRTNPQIIVNPGPYIEILPANPAFIVVPYYNPLIVFAPPRAGFFVGGAISFGYGIRIGAAFRPWGWGVNRFGWSDHRVFINNARWDRTWVNRGTYVHPYAVPRYSGARPAERHELEGRSERERQAARTGRERVEDHRRDDHRRDDHH